MIFCCVRSVVATSSIVMRATKNSSSLGLEPAPPLSPAAAVPHTSHTVRCPSFSNVQAAQDQVAIRVRYRARRPDVCARMFRMRSELPQDQAVLGTGESVNRDNVAVTSSGYFYFCASTGARKYERVDKDHASQFPSSPTIAGSKNLVACGRAHRVKNKFGNPSRLSWPLTPITPSSVALSLAGHTSASFGALIGQPRRPARPPLPVLHPLLMPLL